MTSHHDASIDQLSRESDICREALTNTVVKLREKVSDTVDDVRARLSPAHIKAEVKGYVREGSEQFLSSIERKARDNPLQAVAIGAGLLYPLWGILKTIPVPIALIGAGVWLSAQKTGRDSYARDAAGYARDAAGKISDAGRDAASRLAHSVQDAKTSLVAGAEAVTDKVTATAHDIGDSASGMTDSFAATVKDKTAVAAESVSATASALRDTGMRLANESRNAIEDLVHRNPLLVGGVALAIGAFIAASLPASQAENRMFGERSDEVKDKALEAVSHGVERAKDVAADVVGDVAAAAAREGLNADGLSKAIDGATEGIKAVLDKGMKTALGDGAAAPLASDSAYQPKQPNGGFS